MRAPAVGGAERERAVARQVGERDDGDLPALPCGVLEREIHPVDPARPVGRVGPCAVEEDEERAGAGLVGFGVEDRAREADDGRADGEHPERKEPPGRAVGLGVVVLKPEQQRHAWEPPADRRGRDGAEDQPEDRQGDQAEEQDRAREAYGAEGPHQCTRSRPRGSCTRCTRSSA